MSFLAKNPIEFEGYMIQTVRLTITVIICWIWCISTAAFAETRQVTISTDIDALTAYEIGFAYDVMRAPDSQGVMLYDLVLIENDSPGSGASDKGTWLEEIHHGVTAKKTFHIDDPKAFEAHIVLYMTPKNEDRENQEPFYIYFNGKRFEGPSLSWDEDIWHWVNIPVGLLKEGENVVVIGCDTPKGKGYDLLMARADEYSVGGGAYLIEGNASLTSAGQVEVEEARKSGRLRMISVGENSSKSTDGGKTWVKNKLGTTNDVIGEYCIRLSLKRFKLEGKLLSPPVDLWSEIPGHDKIKPFCTVSGCRLYCKGDCPDGTSITWQVRSADTSDMLGDEWGEFRTVGKGEILSVPIKNETGRYLQWRAVLATKDPLKTPVVYGVMVMRTVTYSPPENGYFVWKYENVRQQYSSYDFSFEKWDEPKLQVLRNRLDLDAVIEGAVTDFEKINRVRHHISKQWDHVIPKIEYPEWNALAILNRRDKLGHGGMCIQFSIVFIQALASLGYEARFVMGLDHEFSEVYVDELGKWVTVDAESMFDAYEFETTGGMPLNCLDQHRYFLEKNGFSAEKPINWQAVKPWAVEGWSFLGKPETFEGIPVPLDFSTFTGRINDPEKKNYPPLHLLSAFVRMIPRNNWFSQQYPRPLTGVTYWPWNGYMNWYDEATPRKLQYSLHTDREIDFYPTLNRVEFDAVHTGYEGEIAISMLTFSTYFDGFEINIDDTGWKDSPSEFTWKLRSSALNTVKMRVKKKHGLRGKTSCLQVMYHYKEPYSPRPENW